MRSFIAAMLIASFACACGIFPEEEQYVADVRINDNTTASDQQKVDYWRTYGRSYGF